jgi:hypothetical protein
MGHGREIDPEADARAWREADLPELTPEDVKDLKRAGFDPRRLRRLAAGNRYGRSLAVSVLVCFTDAYPRTATVQDIARAGEASRMTTSRSAADFEAALEARGLRSRGSRTKNDATPSRPPKPQARPDLRRPASGAGWWLGWSLVAFLAIMTTSVLASLDVGIGIVLGVVLLIVGWGLVVKRLLYRRAPVARGIRLLYVCAAIAFVVAAVGAANAVLLGFGRQGVGRVDLETEKTGSHGTRYLQCSVQEPDGTDADLRYTGACPGPMGTPVKLVYLPGEVQPWQPVVGSKGSLVPTALLWGAGTLAGCGLLTRAALRG